MPHPRPFSTVVAIGTMLLLAWSLTHVQSERWLLVLLFAAAYAVLCLRTYTLSSGMLMTAAAPLASTAMILFSPLELFVFVVPGMLVVKVRNQRPWGNTLINIAAVAGGLAFGGWIFREALALLGLTDGPLVYKVIPFLIALQARSLVNYALVAPLIARQRGLTTWQILWETMLQNGLGHLTLNSTGLGFAYLVAREGPAVLLYIVLILLGVHAAVSYYVRRSEVERAAEQDGLTLTRNRRAFDRVAQRSTWHGTLLVVDCDGLKQLNDTMGHLVGDEMLKALAHGLMTAAGEENVFRYGGDEFVVLLEHEAAIPDVERAVERIENLYGASASVGACAIPEEAPDIPRAFPVADQRMYAAKESRRSKRLVGAGI